MKKYKLTINLGLKIMALIFAAFLWLIVANLDKPIEGQRYTDIPVKIVNDDIITSAGEVYQVVDTQGESQTITVSVLVYANREVQDNLKKEDIVATADIKEMDTSTGLVPIKVDIPNYSGKFTSAVATPRNLQIQREKSGKKVFSLTVTTNETTPRDGYILGDISPNPDKITVTGAQSLVDQIDRVVAKIDVTDLYKDSEIKASDLILFDKNGNVMNSGQLETNVGVEEITVSVEVLKVKGVPIVFKTSGTPAEGYQYTGSYSEPETIQICGKSADVDKVEEIDIPDSVLDINGADKKIERTVDITPYLPQGVSLVDENAGKINVTVMIEKEGTRTINFLVSSIKINNIADGLQVSYEPDAEIMLSFNGDEKKLEMLDISNAVSVDLSGYTAPGTYSIPVRVDVPEGIELGGEVKVTLKIERKQQDEHSGEEQPPEENDKSE